MTGTDVKMAPTISFVIPCYNERANVAATIAEIERANEQAGVSHYEIVVVDDCSSDGTGEVVSAMMAEKPPLKLVRNAKNLGFGGAYKEGVKHASKQFVIMIPGDNSHPAGGISPILRQAGEADIVVPYAMNTAARALHRRIASGGFTALMNFMFRLKLPYYNGTALHRTDLLRRIEIKTDGFAYAAEALVKLLKGGATYTTVGVIIRERDEGRSTALKPKTIFVVVKTIASLWLENKALHVATGAPDG